MDGPATGDISRWCVSVGSVLARLRDRHRDGVAERLHGFGQVLLGLWVADRVAERGERAVQLLGQALGGVLEVLLVVPPGGTERKGRHLPNAFVQVEATYPLGD